MKEKPEPSMEFIINYSEDLTYKGLWGVRQNINKRFKKSSLYAKPKEDYQNYKILKELDNLNILSQNLYMIYTTNY